MNARDALKLSEENIENELKLVFEKIKEACSEGLTSVRISRELISARKKETVCSALTRIYRYKANVLKNSYDYGCIKISWDGAVDDGWE